MKRRLAGLPLTLPLLAIAAWGLSRILLTQTSLQGAKIWLQLTPALLLVYAGLQLLVWLALELPERLGWWKGPSKILRDLGLLVVSSLITVVLIERYGRVSVVGLVTTLVTTSAVLTAVVGLAAQETLKDLFAGITLQLDPPFREGDWICLDDQQGVVTQLTLMNTHLIGTDGSQVVLSNSRVAEACLKRFRPGLPVGNQFSLGLDYAFPPSQALELIEQQLQRHPDVLDTPAPRVWVSEFAESSVNYEVLAFQRGHRTSARLQLRSELLEQIWYALERQDQSIPFPVREIRHRREEASVNQRTTVDVVGLLSRNPLLRNLSPEQLQQLAPHTRCIRFARGEVVVREGDPGDALFQVVNGTLEVLKGDGSGEMSRIAELQAGDLFGEMTLCADEPRNATVRTLEETWLLEVERSDLQPLIEADPSTLEGIAQLVAQRRAALTQHASSSSNSVENLLQRMRELFQGMRNK